MMTVVPYAPFYIQSCIRWNKLTLALGTFLVVQLWLCQIHFLCQVISWAKTLLAKSLAQGDLHVMRTAFCITYCMTLLIRETKVQTRMWRTDCLLLPQVWGSLAEFNSISGFLAHRHVKECYAPIRKSRCLLEYCQNSPQVPVEP